MQCIIAIQKLKLYICSLKLFGVISGVLSLCLPNPCLNDGTCSLAPSSGTHTCDCKPGYTSENCEDGMSKALKETNIKAWFTCAAWTQKHMHAYLKRQIFKMPGIRSLRFLTFVFTPTFTMFPHEPNANKKRMFIFSCIRICICVFDVYTCLRLLSCMYLRLPRALICDCSDCICDTAHLTRFRNIEQMQNCNYCCPLHIAIMCLII